MVAQKTKELLKLLAGSYCFSAHLSPTMIPSGLFLDGLVIFVKNAVRTLALNVFNSICDPCLVEQKPIL